MACMHKVVIENGAHGIELQYSCRRCITCVISEAFPDSAFDAEGRCAYCRASSVENNEASREPALRIIDHSPSERSADVVMLFSGGKDSTYALLTLVDWGLRVVAFTLDNGFMPQQARENITRIVAAVGVDHVYRKPEHDFMRRIYRESLAEPAHPDALKYSTAACGACISVVLATGAVEARQRQAPLLAGGWTPGQFTHDAIVPGAFLREVCGSHLNPIARRANLMSEYKQIAMPDDPDFPPLFNPLYCSPYSESEVLRRLSAIGWRRPTNTDSCSSNCTLNGYLVVDHALKYGYHPYEYELAYHVRTGQMNRADAIAKMRVIQVTPDAIKSIGADLGLAQRDGGS